MCVLEIEEKNSFQGRRKIIFYSFDLGASTLLAEADLLYFKKFAWGNPAYQDSKQVLSAKKGNALLANLIFFFINVT